MSIIIAIIVFSIIIIVHELGHFFAAKSCGILVEEFSVGMGPKIFSLSRRGTKFSLRWVLFGGYCAMEGEDKDSSEKGSFSSKSPAARMFVVAAGAIAVAVFAVDAGIASFKRIRAIIRSRRRQVSRGI